MLGGREAQNGGPALEWENLVAAVCKEYEADPSVLYMKKHRVDGCITPSEYKLYRMDGESKPDTSDTRKGETYQSEKQGITTQCPQFAETCLQMRLTKMNVNSNYRVAENLPMCWRADLGKVSKAQDNVAKYVYDQVYPCLRPKETPECNNDGAAAPSRPLPGRHHPLHGSSVTVLQCRVDSCESKTRDAAQCPPPSAGARSAIVLPLHLVRLMGSWG